MILIIEFTFSFLCNLSLLSFFPVKTDHYFCPGSFFPPFLLNQNFLILFYVIPLYDWNYTIVLCCSIIDNWLCSIMTNVRTDMAERVFDNLTRIQNNLDNLSQDFKQGISKHLPFGFGHASKFTMPSGAIGHEHTSLFSFESYSKGLLFKTNRLTSWPWRPNEGYYWDAAISSWGNNEPQSKYWFVSMSLI